MTDVAEKLMAIRNKSLEQTPKETQPEEQPVETQEAVPTDESKPVEQEVEPIVETVEPEAQAEESSWDDTPEEEVSTPQTASIDYSELGSALSLGEVKTKEEVIAKVSELKSKLKQLEEKPLEGITEELREIIEVSKTGDWKEYLASQLVDYSQFDPIEEFERDFINRAQTNPKYFTDGKFDSQKVEEALETMPEAVRETYGNQLLAAKAQQQKAHKEALKAKAQAKQAEAERTLATATKNLGELLPLETYGIKFEPKHSSEIYKGIVSSKLTKEFLGQSYEDLVRNGADMKAIAKTITMAKYGEKMIAHKAGKSKVEAKKEVLKSISNVQLNSTGTNLQPENPETKVISPADLLRRHINSSKKGL